jgi:putative oxidoreductase
MKHLVSIILPIFLGGVFIYAGILKLLEPVAFYHDIVLYDLVGNQISWIVAHYLPWLEVIAGVGVTCRFSRTPSALILATLLLIFMGAVSSAWFRGLDIECGCFGRSSEGGSYSWVLIRDIGLLLIALYLVRPDFFTKRDS